MALKQHAAWSHISGYSSVSFLFKNLQWVWLGLIAISIIVSGKLAFQYASLHEVTPVWPPSGIALAALLMLGLRVWPGVSFGYFIADATNYQSVLAGGILALGETSEAVIAALLLQRLVSHQQVFGRTQSVFSFILAATIAPILNTTIGTTVLLLKGVVPDSAYLEVWRTWWTADTVGIIVVTPFLMTWLRRWRPVERPTPYHALELVVLVALFGLTIHQVFGQSQPLEYLFLPLIVWSIFRFGIRGATLLLVSVSVLAIMATAQGLGIFVQSSLNQSLLLLQSFIGVVAITTLTMSAVITEREEVKAHLKQINEELEMRVHERTQDLVEALTNLRKTQAQLVQTEKMSSLGQLVAGIAHEINNPINFIYGNLNPAQEYVRYLLGLLTLYRQEYPQPTPVISAELEAIDVEFLQDDLPKLLTSMKVGAERIRDIVRSLRNFSRLDEAEFKAANIHEGIDNTLMILQNRLKSKPSRAAIEVVKDYGPLPLVECYPGELNQVFMNILTNAVDAVDEALKAQAPEAAPFAPKITIRTDVAPDNWVTIAIADNGLGMSTEVQARLFDPFYTTKPVGLGTGLGLSISYQIVVDKHGGKLTYQSTPGQGTEFVIAIPIRQVHSRT